MNNFALLSLNLCEIKEKYEGGQGTESVATTAELPESVIGDGSSQCRYDEVTAFFLMMTFMQGECVNWQVILAPGYPRLMEIFEEINNTLSVEQPDILNYIVEQSAMVT